MDDASLTDAKPSADLPVDTEETEASATEEDHRWRLTTPEALILFFLEHDRSKRF